MSIDLTVRMTQRDPLGAELNPVNIALLKELIDSGSCRFL